MSGEQRVWHFWGRCKHQRVRARPVLFSGDEMTSAGVLKQQLAWVQQERRLAEAEQRRFLAGAAFVYEPFGYPWCDFYTKTREVDTARAGDDAVLGQLLDGGFANVNPVTGEITPIYMLCYRLNPNADC